MFLNDLNLMLKRLISNLDLLNFYTTSLIYQKIFEVNKPNEFPKTSC